MLEVANAEPDPPPPDAEPLPEISTPFAFWVAAMFSVAVAQAVLAVSLNVRASNS